MDLADLEASLGVEYGSVLGGRERVILPPEKYHLLNDPLDAEGTTRLMQVAGEGSLECVDLLLRCGAIVDARDEGGKTALDHCLLGGGETAAMLLLLLRWDSLIPTRGDLIARLKAAVDGNEDLGRFLRERDEFHRMLVAGGDVGSIERVLGERIAVGDCDPSGDRARRWVSSRGVSALYAAARGRSCNAWALLRARGFDYATEREREDAGAYESDDSFICAVGRHFVDVDGCHVQKMVARSKVYLREGVDGEACGEKVDGYFRAIDGEEHTSDILRCLQDDPSLEIVFDLSSNDVRDMYPIGHSRGRLFGMVDYEANRIYVTAMVTDDFEYSDVVSNLVHELTHKALAVVFENGGLPYGRGDTEVEEEYLRIVRRVLSDENSRHCDRIIQRTANIPVFAAQELIVRVPEMISKYMDCQENGIVRLRDQAPDLLEFYEGRVVPQIRERILRNKTANKVVKSELLKTSSLLTAHDDWRISVGQTTEEVRTCRHNELLLFVVSNLKLGVSHLKKTLEGVIFVDWSKYQGTRAYFRFAMSRNEIKRLAIVWDKPRKPPFCRSENICTNSSCLARRLEPLVDRTVLIVPKKFSVIRETESFQYFWNDLSDVTKGWLLKKGVNFGGKIITLKDMLGGVNGGEGEVEIRNVGRALDPCDISELIDQGNVIIGRSARLAKGNSDLYAQLDRPEHLLPRTLTVRHLDLNKSVYELRANDAFFIVNAKLSDVLEAGIYDADYWHGSSSPQKDVRCFLLEEGGDELSEGDRVFRTVVEELKSIPPPGEEGEGRWHLVHFFEFVDEKFKLIQSLDCDQSSHETISEDVHISGFNVSVPGDFVSGEAFILADAPGSGKSLFAKETARVLKENLPVRWVDVVELSLFEKEIQEWNFESTPDLEEKTDDLLYQLIRGGNSELEQKFLKLHCRLEKKPIIFFDGFDEICPDYKEKFTTFLEALMGYSKVKVCLTTRTHEFADLGKRLVSIVYSLIPFNIDEQVKFLSSEWQLKLNALPLQKRKVKISNIISTMEAYCDKTAMERVSDFVGGMKSMLEEESDSNFQQINFDDLARGIINVGISMDGGGDFSGNPLQAWMIASVAFEENFRVGEYLSLPRLYDRFISLKIDIYSKEKAKTPKYVAGDSKEELFRAYARELLKKFSVFFFLEDKRYEPNAADVAHVLRMGVVTKRADSIVFVHRTFGEYLFSIWLLENAKDRDVTSSWLNRVLLENKFQNVREFLDRMLLAEHRGKSWITSERVGQDDSLLNPLASPSATEFVECIRRGLYKSIIECREGIINYLADCCRENLAYAIFAEPSWDMVNFVVNTPYIFDARGLNMFSFCSQCVKYGLLIQNFAQTRSSMDFLELIPKLLQMVERHELTSHLNRIVSTTGFEWMCLQEDRLWREEEGRMHFAYMFSFLERNGDILAETLRAEVLNKRSEALFYHSAIHIFDSLSSLMEAIMDDEEIRNCILLENGNFARAWMRTVQECRIEMVEGMWSYVRRKLASPQDRRAFLRCEDLACGDTLFAAGCNTTDSRVFPFVWGVHRAELGEAESKACLFKSFDRENSHLSGCVTRGLLNVLDDIMREGHLDRDEVTQLLLSRDRRGDRYLLRFDSGEYSLPALHRLQDFLLDGSQGSARALREMEGHYERLSATCLGNAFHLFLGEGDWPGEDPDFEEKIEEEFRRLPIPSLGSIRIERGILVDVRGKYGVILEGIRVQAFLVLLERQLRLEERILGREELTSRLMGEWPRLFRSLVRCKVEGEWLAAETRAFLVPHFFSLVSRSLSREQVARVVLSGEAFWGTAFHRALDESDCEAFFALYDVARQTMGEDTLWRVHGAATEGGNTVLEALLWKQQEDLFLLLQLMEFKNRSCSA